MDVDEGEEIVISRLRTFAIRSLFVAALSAVPVAGQTTRRAALPGADPAGPAFDVLGFALRGSIALVVRSKLKSVCQRARLEPRLRTVPPKPPLF